MPPTGEKATKRIGSAVAGLLAALAIASPPAHAAFGPVEQISPIGGLNVELPVSAADGTGTRFVAWETEAGIVLRTVAEDGTLGPALTPPGSAAGQDPRLAGAPGPGAVLLWNVDGTSDADPVIGYAFIEPDSTVRNTGTVPVGTRDFTVLSRPDYDAVVGADGRITITWTTHDRGQRAFYAQITPAGTPGDAAELAAGPRGAWIGPPSIEPDGTVHLAWTVDRGRRGNSVRTMALSPDGQPQSAHRPFEGRPAEPAIGTLSGDTIVTIADAPTRRDRGAVRLQIGRLTENRHGYRRLGTLDASRPASGSLNPELALGSGGRGYLVWNGARGPVGVPLDPSGVPGRPLVLSRKGKTHGPSVAIGPDRRPVVAWRQGELRLPGNLRTAVLSPHGRLLEQGELVHRKRVVYASVAASPGTRPLVAWQVYGGAADRGSRVFGASG